MEGNSSDSRLEFFVRLTNLPIVSAAVDQTTNAYGRIKQSNYLLEYSLSGVEKSVAYANKKAQPLYKNFEKQIAVADSLACKGLDRLEQKIPVIKEPTEKILQDTKDLYSSAVQSSVDRYQHLKTYGAQKASAVIQYSTTKFSDLSSSKYGKLVATSASDANHLLRGLYVDGYYLSNRIYHEAFDSGAGKLRTLKEATYDRFNDIKTTLGNIQKNAVWIWTELNKSPEVPEDSKFTMDQKALYFAQQVRQKIVQNYNFAVTSIQEFAPNLFSKVISTYDYPFKTYSTTKKLVSEIREQSFKVLQEKLELLKHVPAFQWMFNVPESSDQPKPESTEDKA